MIRPSISFWLVLALNCLQNSMMLICAWPSAGPTGGAGVALPASICNLTDVCTFFGAICSLFYENLYRLLWHRHSCLCSLDFLYRRRPRLRSKITLPPSQPARTPAPQVSRAQRSSPSLSMSRDLHSLHPLCH